MKLKLSTLALLCCTSLFSSSLLANQPLKQEGKQTLFQRVLSTPTCHLSDTAGKSEGKAIPAFSRYYIYARQTVNNKEWLHVGPDEFGKTVGWLDAECTVAWNIQMTLTFTNPSNRDRLLFFKDKAALENVISSSKKADEIKAIRASLDQNNNVPEIVAQEPKEFVDFQKNFYLLPILQGEEIMNNDGFYERILEVASVSKKENSAVAGTTTTNNNTPANNAGEVTGFKAAVVFVIDSTISMDPYINQTREVVKKLYEKVEKENLQEQVKFGLVAFRSSTEAVPGLEYTSKMYVDPNKVKDSKDFMDKVASLKQARVSSKEFSEDAYAGVQQALNEINWNNFGGRYIVLVTDAGAIDGNNPISTTKMDAKQIRLEAQHKGVALYTLHLKTPSGKNNHEQASTQYNDLAFNNYLNKSLYYPVNAGDVKEFGDKASTLADALISQVKLAYKGEMAAGSSLGAKEEKKEEAKPNNQIEEDAKLLGNAMRLAYLGRTSGQTAPPVFKAWISDKDFIKQDTPTAEVRVLMTKAQLNELHEVVKNILQAATSGLISSEDMFKQLRSVAAAMGQDPNKIKQGTSTKIAELGLLGEYLDGIPYRSQVTGIDEDTWKSMGAQQQEKFMRDLSSKLNHYRAFNSDVSRWIPLAEGSDPKDYVYPVPLEALP
ncbi:vWA domain-containing protein [Glaesserella sp.]|uniref:vWA domain-containing protein n=1 Tax=Glaesserella sp. TaxID=2094731 RepID=UPI00359FD832